MLFPAGDAPALAKVFERVDQFPDWFDQLGASARLTYERRFSPEQNVRQLEAIYRFAIQNALPLGLDPPSASTTATRTVDRSNQVVSPAGQPGSQNLSTIQ